MAKITKKKEKTAEEVAREILQILIENKMFGTVYVEGVADFYCADSSLSPYHAGVLHARSDLHIQKDYKSMGEEIYAQYRKGMIDTTLAFGATRLVTEKD